jgi:exodeoxyribonuclease V beta subunit
MPLTGMQLIEASAGSGKTYTLVLLVLRQLLERAVPISEILLCTFTKAAALELRERIEQRLQQLHAAAQAHGQWQQHVLANDALFAYLQLRWQGIEQQQADQVLIARAINQLPQARIGTIHSFCQQVLSEFNDAAEWFGSELIDEKNLIDQHIDNAIRMGALRLSDQPSQVSPSAIDQPSQVAQSAIDQLSAFNALPITSNRVAAFRQAVHVAYRYPALQFAEVERSAIAIYQARYAELSDPGLREEISTVVNNGAACKLYADKERFVQSVHRVLQGHGQLDLTKVEQFTARIELQKAGSKIRLPKLTAWLNSFALAAQQARVARHYQEMLRLITLTHQALHRHCEYVGARTRTALVGDLAAALDPPETADRQIQQRARRLAGTLRARFPVAFVDEFQDTDPAQLRILRRIYHDGGCMVAVGDPKQSIYRFRGADLHSYLQFADALPTRYSLDFNFRARPALIAACNATLVPVADAFFATPGMTMRPIQAPPALDQALNQASNQASNQTSDALQWIAVECQETNKQQVVAAIYLQMALRIQQRMQAIAHADVSHENAGENHYQIAVLLPKRADIAIVQKALADLAIDAITSGNVSVFAQPAASVLHAILLACAARHDLAAARAALLELLLLTQTTKDAFIALETIDGASFVADACRALESAGPHALVGVVMQQLSMFGQTVAPSSPEAASSFQAQNHVGGLVWLRTTTDFQHLAELLTSAIERQDMAMLPRKQLAEQLAQWLLQRLPTQGAAKYRIPDTHYDGVEVPDADVIADGADQLRNIDRNQLPQSRCSVVLMTLHSAKGLEFNEVHLPLLWESVAKSAGAVVLSEAINGQAQLVFDGGSANYQLALAQDQREQALEKRRLLYVAVTRAIDAVRIYFPESQAAQNAANRHESVLSANPESALGHWLQLLAQQQILPRMIRETLAPVDQDDPQTAKPVTQQTSFVSAESLVSVSANRSMMQKRAIQVVHSFSSLSASATAVVDPNQADATAIDPAGVGVSSAPAEAVDPFHAQALLQALRGAEFGTLIHALLELDREAMSTERLRLLSERIQDRTQRSLIIDQAPNLLAMIRRVRTTPLIAGIALDDVAPQHRIAEFAFQMPAASVDWPAFAALGPAHGLPPLLPYGAYFNRQAMAQHVNDLLIGFVDAVVMIEQRYHIIDFKTNWLGASLSDYRSDKLANVIDDQHYHLQYLLYILALHRYLRAVLPGYQYAQHMGDAHYLFVRAFGLDARPEPGWPQSERPQSAQISETQLGHYRTRAPEALIVAMDAFLHAHGGAVHD